MIPANVRAFLRSDPRLAFFYLNVAGRWRRLAKVKRTPGIWTAHIPAHPEQEARRALAYSKAYGRPRLP